MNEEEKDVESPKSDPERDECGKCGEYLAGWKRAQADYANLKKETEREKLEFSKYANERLLASLLPAIDQYELALQHLPDLTELPEEHKKKLANWIVGLEAVRVLWGNTFKEIGLEPIEPDKGEAFDPLVHEAIGQEAIEGLEEGKVSRLIQPGWRLNGKLLRPARVMVSKS